VTPNTGCCRQRGRSIVSGRGFCAATLRQNPVSLGRLQLSMRIPLRGTPDDWFAWLDGSHEKRRQEAKLILGGLTPDDPIAPEPLIARLADPNPEIVFWAVVGLSCMERRSAAALLQLIRVASLHTAFGNRQAALEALARVAPREPVAKQAILYALGDESLWVRIGALRALIEIPELSEDDLAAIRTLEDDPETMVRDQAEITLRNIRLRPEPAA
jgi:HEAT repeat protein